MPLVAGQPAVLLQHLAIPMAAQLVAAVAQPKAEQLVQPLPAVHAQAAELHLQRGPAAAAVAAPMLSPCHSPVHTALQGGLPPASGAAEHSCLLPDRGLLCRPRLLCGCVSPCCHIAGWVLLALVDVVWKPLYQCRFLLACLRAG